MSSTFKGNIQNNVITLLKILQNEERNVCNAYKKVKGDLSEINVLKDKIGRIQAALKILQGNND